MAKAYSTTVPRPDPEREKAGAVKSDVTTRKMTPEEFEKHFGKKTSKMSAEEKADYAALKGVEVVAESGEVSKPIPKSSRGPDKQKFLELIASGKSIAAAERELGLKVNGMYYWLKQWGLIGINPGKARELLGIKELVRDAGAVEAVEQTVNSTVSINMKSAELQQKDAIINRLRAENERLKAIDERETDIAISIRNENKELLANIISYEAELAAWVQRENDSAAQLADAIAERDQRELELVDAHYALQEAKQAIEELQEERKLLLETIELASADQPAADNVNRPAHYTAGGIETIDYMRAKMSDDEFAGYCRGNVIKYISRAPQKNGVEDYRKAAWYLNRLIGAQ